MGIGMLRSILRPLSQRAQLSSDALSQYQSIGSLSPPLPNSGVGFVFSSPQNSPITHLAWTGMMAMRWKSVQMGMHSLTDTQFTKHRPSNNCRRKRASLKPPETKKQKARMQEAKRRKQIKRVERKMAAVARERAWAERLAGLLKLEAEGKKKTDA